MKAKEIKALSPSELDAKLTERISAVKKDIARIKTVMRDVELHGAQG